MNYYFSIDFLYQDNLLPFFAAENLVRGLLSAKIGHGSANPFVFRHFPALKSREGSARSLWVGASSANPFVYECVCVCVCFVCVLAFVVFLSF